MNPQSLRSVRNRFFVRSRSSGLRLCLYFIGLAAAISTAVPAWSAPPSFSKQLNGVDRQLSKIKLDTIRLIQSRKPIQAGTVDGNLQEIAVLMKKMKKGSGSGSQAEAGGQSPGEMRLLLADRLVQARMGSQAKKILENLARKTQREPVAAGAWFRLEKIYYQEENYPQALRAFYKISARSRFPQRQEATYLAGNSFLYMKEYLKAIGLLGKISEGSNLYPFAVYSNGLAYLNLGDAWSSTRLEFQKLIDFNPQEDPAVKELMNKTRLTLGAFFIDQKRYPEAVSVFSPIATASRYRPQARFGTGLALKGMNECVKAIVVFKNLIEKAPLHPYGLEARLHMGNCYSKLIAHRRAVDSYQVALQLYSGQRERLSKELQQAKRLGPEDWFARAGRPSADRRTLGLSSVPDFIFERDFPEVWVRFDDWRRLAGEISRLGSSGDGSASDIEKIQNGLKEVRKGLGALVQTAVMDLLSDRIEDMDALGLRANIGIAKNMILMQDR